MGPPPSPKEPRRSGRRSVPSHSSSKSPAPSPHPESVPRLKENRPTLSSSSSSRSKRSKQEEIDEPFEDMPKPPTNHQNNGRNKRKPKDKQSTPTPPSIDNNHTQKDTRVSEEPADTSAQEEEGVTRCICGNAGSFTSRPYSARLTSPLSFTLSEDEPDTGEVMVQCDICRVWQHIACMGIEAPPDDADYFCEQCRPDLHPNLLKYVSQPAVPEPPVEQLALPEGCPGSLAIATLPPTPTTVRAKLTASHVPPVLIPPWPT